MTIAENAQLGLSMRFDVVVDGNNLGSWSSCKGLSVKFKHLDVKELGQHEYITRIPDRVDFPRVILQRAMVKGDWDKTRAWLKEVAEAGWITGEIGFDQTRFSTSGGTGATITLRDAHLDEVVTWTLANALPIAWKAPVLDAAGKKIALETLELVHEGFLDA